MVFLLSLCELGPVMTLLLFSVRLSPAKYFFFSATVSHTTKVAIKTEVQITVQTFHANLLLLEFLVQI